MKVHLARVRSSLAFAASLLGLTFGSAWGADAPPNSVALTIAPTQEHSRNSEGSVATLASGRIIFC